MMGFPLKSPSLPQSKVTAAAVSDYDEELISKLISLNIEPVITVKNDKIKTIGYHTDLFILNCSQGELFCDRSQSSNFVNFLTKGYNLKEINENVTSPHPFDCFLNIAIMGNMAIFNPKTAHSKVIDTFKIKGYKLIETNQGYTKCSVCPVNHNALITDDESIYKSCEINQIDSLLISKGSIKLKGFDYGFIGGCTGKIDKNKLLFNGDINYHKDCNKIIDFLNNYNVSPEIIDNKPLVDVGSVIPICEETI